MDVNSFRDILFRRRRERDYVSGVLSISSPFPIAFSDCKFSATNKYPSYIHTHRKSYAPSEKRLKIGNIAKIIFGAQEAPILALFWRF